jgi:NitT/TauT family transport system substrate-binding protein
MPQLTRPPRLRAAHRVAVPLAAGLLLLAAACAVPDSDQGATATPPAGGAAASRGATPATEPGPLTSVRVALPYQPNVQFAPLYLAEDRGYYRDAGLDLRFEYGDESQQMRLVAAGEREAMVAGGDQVILGRAAGLPVTYVMTWFQRFPVAVFSLDPALRTPADLVGRTVGLPAPGGTSILGWQALLLASGIQPESVTTEVIGFTQREAVLLAADGNEVAVIEVADTVNLVSNGLVVGASTARDRPELVQGLVTATLRGIADTLADPDAAFEAALVRVPEAGDPAARAVQRQVLEASLRFWEAPRLGAIDEVAWEQSQDTMRQLGLIDATTPLAELVDPRFVAAARVPDTP